MPAHRVPLATRFWKYVRKSDGCWEWIGARTGSGYGAIIDDFPSRRMLLAHRIAYTETKGEIPDGLTLDHLCRNPGCVNPDHLEAVTQRENTLRGNGASAQNARKTHCHRGHKFTAENTFLDKRGKRYCRTCQRNHWR